MLFSTSNASLKEGVPFLETPVGRQLLSIFLGLGLFAALAALDYRLWGYVAPILYILLIGLLVAVLVPGEGIHGTRRWINLGTLPFQPSEAAKLLLILTLGKYLSDNLGTMKRWRTLASAAGLLAAPAVLIYLQPDLGTLVIFGAIWMGMVAMAGARVLHLGLLAGSGVVLVPFVYSHVLKDYMRERLAAFVDPGQDPWGIGYNILQSQISVGSGGFWGKGLGMGTQSQLNFLRVTNTDFIFSVLSEELGFLGALLLLALFTILLLRGLGIALRAKENYGRLVAVGVVGMLLVQVFINVGVNVSLIPVTGVPLPLISYGGNSLITVLSSLGLLQSIAIRHRRLTFS